MDFILKLRMYLERTSREAPKLFKVFLALIWVIPACGVESIEVNPPYKESDRFLDIVWDTSTTFRAAEGSDNWAVTWAQDGTMIATWGDGGGFGGTNRRGRVSLGIAQIDGPPGKMSTQNLWGGFMAKNDATFGGKSLGILAIEDRLFMWVGPNSGRDAWRTTHLAESGDNGATWILSADPFFSLDDGFSKPTFLNFGPGYLGARDAYVYIYAPDASSNFTQSIVDLNLARAPVEMLADRNAYQFFAGLDSNSRPRWVTDIALKRPVFKDTVGGLADSPSVTFNHALNRYLMCKTNDSRNEMRAGGGLGIFESPEPWGPWRTVTYVDKWMGSDNMYHCTIPTKWISDDGFDLWMIFTGSGDDNIARDAYQHIRGRISIERSNIEQ